MITDINPYREFDSRISPADFEVFCMETLKAYAKRENIKDFKIKHNQKICVDDGTYQIDVLAEYTALGVKNTVVVECKKQSRSVEREIVAALNEKLHSIGAQKGIIISTSGFQSGATLFAGKHGIALWQICDNYIKHFSMSASEQYLNMMRFQFEIERYLPKYFALEWDCSADFPYTEIYPTEEMYALAIKKARESYHA